FLTAWTALTWALPAASEGPLSVAERQRLQEQAVQLTQRADQLYAAGKPAEALPLATQAVAIPERLYPRTTHPDGHGELAPTGNAVGYFWQGRGESRRALVYFERALDLFQRLYRPEKFSDGHADLATGLGNVAFVLQRLGDPGRAL